MLAANKLCSSSEHFTRLNKRSYYFVFKLAILEPPSTQSTTFVQLELSLRIAREAFQ